MTYGSTFVLLACARYFPQRHSACVEVRSAEQEDLAVGGEAG